MYYSMQTQDLFQNPVSWQNLKASQASNVKAVPNSRQQPYAAFTDTRFGPNYNAVSHASFTGDAITGCNVMKTSSKMDDATFTV